MDIITIQGYGDTDKGKIRPTNEDCFGIQKNLFIVADGMGGHNAGEVASKLTVESILKNSEDLFHLQSIKTYSVDDYKELIKRMITNANRKVIRTAMENPAFTGMGSTLVLALFQQPNILHIANVGDSRAYLFRRNVLEMKSQDHSLATIMNSDYHLALEDAQSSVYQKYLTRAVGIHSTIKPYYTSIALQSGDKILLCSDGLWTMISDEEISTILQKDLTDSYLCRELIVKANDLGGFDNITVVIISVNI